MLSQVLPSGAKPPPYTGPSSRLAGMLASAWTAAEAESSSTAAQSDHRCSSSLFGLVSHSIKSIIIKCIPAIFMVVYGLFFIFIYIESCTNWVGDNKGYSRSNVGE